MKILLLMFIFGLSSLGCSQKLDMSGGSAEKDMAAVAIDSEEEAEDYSELAEFMDLLESGNDDEIMAFLDTCLEEDGALTKLYTDIDEDGQGFIHYVAEKGSLDVIRRFLELAESKGVLKDVVNFSSERYKVQPIHLAALRGDVDVLRCFIKNGADPNAQDTATNTVLHYGARMLANVPVVKYLLEEAGASIKETIDKDDGSTLLHWAVENNNASMVRYLLDYCYSHQMLDFINEKDKVENVTAEELAFKLERSNINLVYKSFKKKNNL